MNCDNIGVLNCYKFFKNEFKRLLMLYSLMVQEVVSENLDFYN